MKVMRVVCALISSLAATAVLAHAHLQKSVPANGAVVNAAPTSVVLTFSEPAKLTACWLQKGDGPKEKLSGLVPTAAREISLPVPKLESGKYVLSWRAVGDDGHIVPGQIQFTLAAPTAPAAAQPVPH